MARARAATIKSTGRGTFGAPGRARTAAQTLNGARASKFARLGPNSFSGKRGAGLGAAIAKSRSNTNRANAIGIARVNAGFGNAMRAANAKASKSGGSRG